MLGSLFTSTVAIPTGGPPTVHVHTGGALVHNPASSADAYKCEICMTGVPLCTPHLCTCWPLLRRTSDLLREIATAKPLS